MNFLDVKNHCSQKVQSSFLSSIVNKKFRTCGVFRKTNDHVPYIKKNLYSAQFVRKAFTIYLSRYSK